MPIYEYHCDACTHNFEVIQKVTDDKLTYCPECGKHKLRKMVTAAAFRLKGSGWYETDFKNKPKPSSDGEGTAKGKETTETKKAEPTKKAPAAGDAKKKTETA